MCFVWFMLKHLYNFERLMILLLLLSSCYSNRFSSLLLSEIHIQKRYSLPNAQFHLIRNRFVSLGKKPLSWYAYSTIISIARFFFDFIPCFWNSYLIWIVCDVWFFHKFIKIFIQRNSLLALLTVRAWNVESFKSARDIWNFKKS
jgi:hypothetical protein